jgi:hypothetical protein
LLKKTQNLQNIQKVLPFYTLSNFGIIVAGVLPTLENQSLAHRFAVPPLPQAGEGCGQLIFRAQTKM